MPHPFQRGDSYIITIFKQPACITVSLFRCVYYLEIYYFLMRAMLLSVLFDVNSMLGSETRKIVDYAFRCSDSECALLQQPKKKHPGNIFAFVIGKGVQRGWRRT